MSELLGQQITRSYGILERFLSNWRASKAGKLIKNEKIDPGRILDIGSGVIPNFLIKSEFHRKYGIENTDINQSVYKKEKIRYYTIDLEKRKRMPFSDNYFNCITMLAVFEHLTPSRLPDIINEIYRILKKDGLFILTTPARWTEKFLKVLSFFRIVSDVEIRDHKDQYTIKKIFYIFKNTKFNRKRIEGGFFEMYMNIWMKAVK
ncbi:MAG: class I SAM-dependent methyltransferase [Spirochaetes bacterium]|nr:class I SAM-dependent methyltransferase [Spirochaetota bacterium]